MCKKKNNQTKTFHISHLFDNYYVNISINMKILKCFHIVYLDPLSKQANQAKYFSFPTIKMNFKTLIKNNTICFVQLNDVYYDIDIVEFSERNKTTIVCNC